MLAKTLVEVNQDLSCVIVVVIIFIIAFTQTGIIRIASATISEMLFKTILVTGIITY